MARPAGARFAERRRDACAARLWIGGRAMIRIPIAVALFVEPGVDVRRPSERLFFVVEQGADGRNRVLAESPTRAQTATMAAPEARRRGLVLIGRAN
jgi:hypothetical protein